MLYEVITGWRVALESARAAEVFEQPGAVRAADHFGNGAAAFGEQDVVRDQGLSGHLDGTAEYERSYNFV